MLPIFAIVGRPNVGKSTLFNRLTRTRAALVGDMIGITRDRQYAIAQCNEQDFILIDTGGLESPDLKGGSKAAGKIPKAIGAQMAKQAWLAAKEAQVVLFMVDARSALTEQDKTIAAKLRKLNKKILLVVNKVDGRKVEEVASEFYALGFEDIYFISAEHGNGTANLGNAIANYCRGARLAPAIPEPESRRGSGSAPAIPESSPQVESKDKQRIKVAFIGRPNVGKSTLVNRILGEERVIVSPESGTTRDSIFIDFDRRSHHYTLIDTAGIRRRGKVIERIEKFSVVKALQAIEEAQVVVLVLDAQENVTEQDLHLLGFAIDSGRALVIAVNKWDGLTTEQRAKMQRSLERRLSFAEFAPVHFISALHGTGVGNIFTSINKAYASATKEVKTAAVTKILLDAVEHFPPPLVKGRRIKLRYAHVGGHNPPLIVVHGNQTEFVPQNYRKYLERTFRNALHLVGTPIQIEFKTGYNPYSE